MSPPNYACDDEPLRDFSPAIVTVRTGCSDDYIWPAKSFCI